MSEQQNPLAQLFFAAAEADYLFLRGLFVARRDLTAIWQNGEWPEVEGRSVVAFSLINAAYSLASRAARVKIIEAKIPSGLADVSAFLIWARQNAVLYNSNSAPQPLPAADFLPAADLAVASVAVPIVDISTQSFASTIAQDESGPRDDIPSIGTLEKPATAPKQPRKRHLRSVFNGNAALQPQEDAEPLPASMSEDHVADDFAAAQENDLRYISQRNIWLVWTGYWKPDEKKEVDRRVVEHCRSALLWSEAAALTQDGKRRVGSKAFAGHVRDFTMSDRRIAAIWEQFGRDPFLLGVPGGTVDLKTGVMREARREDYITRCTAVSPSAGEPTHWIKFITHICKGDTSIIQYIQRWCGYLISGDSSEEALLVCYGPAQRGKSKFVGALREILKTYAAAAGMDTFTESRMERHSEELASLAGARMIVASETDAGKRWNEARIKALTGRDVVRARNLHENSFEFSLGKIIVACNHIPALRNIDDSFRRRLHILEFSNPVPEDQIDRRLDDKLREEYPQILQWMITGTQMWLETGLGRPEQISDSVERYMDSEDTLGEYLEACVVRDRDARTLSGDLYISYKRWQESVGGYVTSQKGLTQALCDRGFSRLKAGGRRYVGGLRLVEQAATRFDPYA